VWVGRNKEGEGKILNFEARIFITDLKMFCTRTGRTSIYNDECLKGSTTGIMLYCGDKHQYLTSFGLIKLSLLCK
jgi:hypothetical protein